VHQERQPACFAAQRGDVDCGCSSAVGKGGRQQGQSSESPGKLNGLELSISEGGGIQGCSFGAAEDGGMGMPCSWHALLWSEVTLVAAAAVVGGRGQVCNVPIQRVVKLCSGL